MISLAGKRNHPRHGARGDRATRTLERHETLGVVPFAAVGARVVVADPPWKFGDALPGPGRGARKFYPCLSADEIKRFPLPPLADDCLLLLWRVAAMQREALDVLDAWGFTLKSEIVWNKLTCGPAPLCKACGRRKATRHFGMGHYTRASHETCLVAVRGRVKVVDRSIRSTFSAPIGEHSAKPDEIFCIAERLVPVGPYVELFARRPRAGWYTLGNEATGGMHVNVKA